MTSLLILVANILILVANLSVLAIGVKLYTEVYKKGSIERIGK